MTAHNVRSGGWARFLRAGGYRGAAPASTMDLAKILDTVHLPMVVLQRNHTIAGYNMAAATSFGLSPSVIGLAPHEVTVLSLLPGLAQHCTDAMADGVEPRVDFRSGDDWFTVRICPYATKGDAFIGTVLTFTDVTAFRRHIDQAVYERECTKAILNAVGDPLVVLSADQLVESGNRAFYELFGVSRDVTRGLSVYELAGGLFKASTLRRQLRKMLSGSDVFDPVEIEGVVTLRGLRTLSVDAHPLFFPGHTQRRILLMFQDITTRKQAEVAKDLRSEEELRRSEAFLAEGQRLSSTGSFSWKVGLGTMTWSEQLYRIYGLEVGTQVTLGSILTRVHPEDVAVLERVIEQARRGLDEFEWQYRLVMSDGSTRYLQAVARAARDQFGSLEYFAAVQDVTARRVSEEALAKASSELTKVARAASLGVITASIAHEVTQPLSGIITNAGTCLRMLDAEPPNVEGARETARRTIRDGNRASEVIARLRALFSNTKLTLELLDINEVALEVLALSSSDLLRNRATVRSELADDLPKVTGDRVQLEQVIFNLIRNACEAMADVDDRARRLMIRTEQWHGDHVKLSVSDCGVGVDFENVTRLFDPFYTTKSDGMGMGLSVSSSIIERHGGRLWAEANHGPGATFSFSVPSRPRGNNRAPAQ